ncbi:MAG: ECF-type sigma factor [Phycisphaerales bacterium]
MSASSQPEPVTQLLAEAGASGVGEPPARLLELVYDQLRRLAEHRMRSEVPGHTLQATALVHEAYARLVGGAEVQWRGRGHFFAAAAEAMRRILIDHARSRSRVKRGGTGEADAEPFRSGTASRRRVPLNIVDLASGDEPDEILSVDEAFQRLRDMDPDLARVVQLRFFAGLSEAETAEALGVSDRTVRREWTVARAWLRRWLDQQRAQEGRS